MLEPIVDHEDKGRAGRRAEAGDTASPIQPPQTVLPPQSRALGTEGTLLCQAAEGHRLHAGLDGVGGEEEEVVRDTRRRAGDGLLPEGQRLGQQRLPLRRRGS